MPTDMKGLRAWLWWRLPRLWMNRTAYAFWVIEQRQRLGLEVRAIQDSRHDDR